MKKLTLTEQFLLICVSIIIIVIVSLGMVLPKTLLPVYEENLYNYLNQSLNLLEKPENNRVDSEVAYIYIDNDKNIYISNNLSDVINIKSTSEILKNINDSEGKIVRGKKVYYYYTSKTDVMTKVAITTDSYINSMKKEILKIILVVVGITFIIISLLVLIWSNNLVNRIKKLKDKEIYPYGNNGEYTKEILDNDNTLINRLSNNKSKYCLLKEKNNEYLDLCTKNNMMVVIPSEIGGYTNIKKSLTSGSIILLEDISNIDIIIKYINSKGYSIVPLSKLLIE